MCANKFLLCIYTTFCIQVIYSFKLTYILEKNPVKNVWLCVFGDVLTRVVPFHKSGHIYIIYTVTLMLLVDIVPCT